MKTYKYSINIVELWCTYSKDGASKAKVLLEDKSFSVEDYVKKVYEDQHFVVIKGADLHLFLWFCCGKFDNVTGQNWGGETFVTLNNANNAICTNGRISERADRLISNACQMWSAYYKEPPKSIIRPLLLDSINCFNKTEL